MKQRSVAVAVGLVLVCAGCAAPAVAPGTPTGAPTPVATQTMEVMIDAPAYPDLAALTAASDYLVTLELVSSESQMSYPSFTSDDPKENPYEGTGQTPAPSEIKEMGAPVTLHRMKVVESLAGELRPGEVIVVRQAGGIVDGTDYRAADVPTPEDLQRGPVFLSRTPQGEYLTPGGRQAVYQESNGEYRALSEDPGLTFKQAQLKTIRESVDR